MKKKYLILLSLTCLLFYSTGAFADRAPNLGGGDIVPTPPLPFAVTKAQMPLECNEIRAFIWNTGVFNQDLRTNNTAGFEWPINTGKTAIFTTGLSIGVMYQGNLRMANASYNGEYGPGYVEGGLFKTDSRFKIYSVKAGDNASTNPDWANWGLMIPFGAPWQDINLDGSYDPNVDIPGIKDAGQTIFLCLTDADPNTHTTSEGFSGGTLPIFAEVHLTAWAYNTPGLTSLQFIQWVVINKSNVAWNSTHFGIVCDPDLGWADDDYIGCDVNENLAFCYNADNMDGTGTTGQYGLNPPASGMDYFRSPLVYTGDPNDIDTIYPTPGLPNKIIKTGYKQIGLTSFVYFTNTGSGPPVCENDPSSVDQAYNYLQGKKRDGTSWVDFLTRQPTVFCYPGDPETNTGWTEFDGRIENCNLALTGPEVSPVPSGDRRFIFNSGSTSFTVNPGDTQYVVLGQMVAQGADHKNSVTVLKGLDPVAQKVYNLNFKVIPPPPPPVVKSSYKPNSNVGTFDITFTWGDTSESYLFDDVLFNTGFYKFQGYEVYEIKRSASVLPDFNNLSSINQDVKLLAIYDLKDTIGFIYDSLKVGYFGTPPKPAYGWVPIVPHYGASTPAGFPNSGLTRNITLTQTYYQGENGNRSKFIYGNSYKFAIIAYGYNSNGLKTGKVVRNSLTSSIITVTPEAPLMGTKYYYTNGDTLLTGSRRDLGLMPIVRNQDLLRDAKYRIMFNSPDTTYNIYRSLDNWNTYSLMKANLKFTNQRWDSISAADDSARIVDGILFKIRKIIYKVVGTPAQGDYQGNVGVIRDLNLAKLNARDSMQSRFENGGWEYIPENNRNLEGSKFEPTNKDWNSASMALTYPTKNTFTGFRSLLNPENLKRVRIEFTGTGNGQQAYRFIKVSGTNYSYQNMIEVPFKVYEVDPYDSSGTPRQLNIALCEFADNPDNKWEPTADSLGGQDVIYIFNSNYDPNPNTFYTSKNLLVQQPQIDVMYGWCAKLRGPGAAFQNGDQLIIYPYTVTRPEVVPGYALYYEVESKAPLFGNTSNALENNELDKIRVVPNPYYGFNTLETPTTGRFVTFRRLPKQCSIKIFTLNGDLIKKLEKNDNTSTLRWDLENQDDVPIASGIYIALIDAPGIGSKVIKLAVFTPQERIDF